MANPCTSIYTTKSFADEQPDWSFLLRFRQEPIAVTCDIEGMFHQVHINPERCDLLRFLWWEEILDPGSWILPYYSSPVRRHAWTESRRRSVAWNEDRPRFAVDSGIRVPLEGRRRVAEWWRERDHLEKRRPRGQEIRRLTLTTSLFDQRKKRESSVFLIGTKHASGSALLEVHSETKEMSEEGTTQSGPSFSWRFRDRKVDHPRSAGQSLSPDKLELPAKEVGEA